MMPRRSKSVYFILMIREMIKSNIRKAHRSRTQTSPPKKSPLRERAKSNLLEENRGDRNYDAAKQHTFLLYLHDEGNHQREYHALPSTSGSKMVRMPSSGRKEQIWNT
jgi:hypothetical protein